jgi:DNA-binding MarR family transcriptional regulator
LGEKTLITKGTMTGVLDRLEAKGLLARTPCREDGRSWITTLTANGQSLFDEIFPAHIKHLEPLFSSLSDDELATMHVQLRRLRGAFDVNGLRRQPKVA